MGGSRRALYQGADRRQAGGRFDVEPAPILTAGSLTLMVIVLAAAASVWWQSGPGPVDPAVLSSHLDAAVLSIAVLVGVLCMVRFRLLGDAPAAWMGLAVLVYGIGTVGIGRLLPALLDVGAPFAASFHPVSGLVVVVLFARASWSQPVDAALRPARVALVVSGATIGVTAGLNAVWAVPALLDTWSPAFLSILWLATAVAFSVRGARSHEGLFAWFALLLLALGLANAAHLAALASVPPLWLGAPGVLRIAGLLFASTGAVHELVRIYGQQGQALLQSVAREGTVEARLRAEQAVQEERAHEARNALAAIEGATRTLEHHQDHLAPGTRASLAAAISSEIARLQRLVTADGAREPPVFFSVADALDPIVTAMRARQLDIAVSIPRELVVHGRSVELQAAVQNLLENADRYARSTLVTLSATADTGGVVICVEDRGPGVPPAERQRIFSRGFRGHAATGKQGSGLGLFVTARLVEGQGGRLWVQDREGGGASFRLWLPGAPVQKVEDQLPQALEVESAGR